MYFGIAFSSSAGPPLGPRTPHVERTARGSTQSRRNLLATTAPVSQATTTEDHFAVRPPATLSAQRRRLRHDGMSWGLRGSAGCAWISPRDHHPHRLPAAIPATRGDL